MIKICRIALAWLFLCAQVFAQSIPFPGPGMPASSGGTSFAIAFGAVSSTTTNVANVWTFAGQAIGTSDATRIVVVGIMETLCVAACGVSAVTVNGNTATQATGAFHNSVTAKSADIWYAPCGTVCGVTTTITVTTNHSAGELDIITWSVIGTSDAFSSAGGSASAAANSTTATLTVPAGGGTIGFGTLAGGTAASFTNLGTSDTNGSCCGGWVAGAHDTASSGSTAFTITFTGTANRIAGAFATFSP